VLLFGPGGCGKRALATAAAVEAGASLVAVNLRRLVDSHRSWQAPPDKLLNLIGLAAKARRPCLIMLRGFEYFWRTMRPLSEPGNTEQRRCLTEFIFLCQDLRRVDDSNTGMMVVGITHSPWLIDSWLRRRFEKRVYVGLPDEAKRTRLLQQLLLSPTCSGVTAEVISRLAAESAGLTLSEIIKMTNAATSQHVIPSFSAVSRSVTRKALAEHASWADEYA